MNIREREEKSDMIALEGGREEARGGNLKRERGYDGESSSIMYLPCDVGWTKI